VPASRLLADEGFRTRLADYGVRAEAAPVGAGWYPSLLSFVRAGLPWQAGQRNGPAARRWPHYNRHCLRRALNLRPRSTREITPAAITDLKSGQVRRHRTVTA
jgi:hypothetical protein